MLKNLSVCFCNLSYLSFLKYNSTFNKITVQGIPITIDYSSDLYLNKGSMFSQLNKSFLNDRVNLSLGIRTDINNYSSEMMNPLSQLSPMFSFSYSFSKAFSFNGNIARYHQLPAYTILGYRDMQGELSNLNNDLKYKFGIKKPKILVCGLNPHAGEEGILGNEEINIIKPAIQSLRKLGIHIDGPVPADTAFIAKFVKEYDVIHTMYHDQGLPVIKYDDFSKTTNVTLGLPIIRVSVDHGTATDLVGKGTVDISSFVQALKVARDISKSAS